MGPEANNLVVFCLTFAASGSQILSSLHRLSTRNFALVCENVLSGSSPELHLLPIENELGCILKTTV